MKKHAYFISLLLAVMAAIMVAGCSSKEKPLIRIFGSTTIEPYITRATAVYAKNSTATFDIRGTGSSDGIDSLLAGACDIAMSSMEITKEQITTAAQKGIQLEVILLGYDVIVPIVHPSNKVADITIDQLKDIYAGKIRRWSVIGGIDSVIDVVERSGASGTYSVWHHEVVPALMPVESLSMQQSNSAVLSYVAERKNTIAYLSAAFLNPEVKPLNLNGVAITENDSLLHEYHLKRPLYLYLNEENVTRAERSLVMFLVIHEEGRKLLRECGYYSGLTLAPLYNAVEKISKR